MPKQREVGRPETDRKANLSLTIKPDLKKWLGKHSYDVNMSMSQIVENLLESKRKKCDV